MASLAPLAQLPEVRGCDHAVIKPWSLVFFASVFSHALLNRPASGDVRVQPDLGRTPCAPHSAIVDESRVFLSMSNAALLHAHVDGPIADDRFMLHVDGTGDQ